MRRKWETPFGAALLISGLGLISALGLSVPAAAAPPPRCSAAALSGFGVANVAIESATDVAANGADPAYCSVEGSVATQGDGAGPGSAKFILKLPAGWNHRLVFFGCGGNCGSVNSVSANPRDVAAALSLGYAAVNTDAGHEQDPSTPDPTWILIAPGVPNEPAIVDFFYRAVHQVTLATKQLARDYYSGAIVHAYFDGCSTGGRQSLMEGERYPEDFDGLIAGDPIMDLDDQRAATIKQAKAFLPADAYIPFSLIPSVDDAVNADCDAADGVADGLIQNPAICNFDPHALVPATLTAQRADAMAVYLRKVVDQHGRPVAPGMTVGDYATSGFEGQAEVATPATDPGAAEPWGGIGQGPSAWRLGDAGIRYFIEHNPAYDVNNDWPEQGNVISAAAVTLLRQRSGAGDADDPRALRAFLRQGRKIILYHGFSDDLASPYRSIWFYRSLARLEQHGVAGLRDRARLFMVPGMGHCGGGSGPNSFATLTALDDWVTNGVAPDAIVATNSRGGRTMPLCQYPEEARYGGGAVDDAGSWACRAGDRRLLRIGPDGARAGADADYQPGPDPGGQ